MLQHGELTTPPVPTPSLDPLPPHVESHTYYSESCSPLRMWALLVISSVKWILAQHPLRPLSSHGFASAIPSSNIHYKSRPYAINVLPLPRVNGARGLRNWCCPPLCLLSPRSHIRDAYTAFSPQQHQVLAKLVSREEFRPHLAGVRLPIRRNSCMTDLTCYSSGAPPEIYTDICTPPQYRLLQASGERVRGLVTRSSPCDGPPGRCSEDPASYYYRMSSLLRCRPREWLRSLTRELSARSYSQPPSYNRNTESTCGPHLSETADY